MGRLWPVFKRAWGTIPVGPGNSYALGGRLPPKAEQRLRSSDGYTLLGVAMVVAVAFSLLSFVHSVDDEEQDILKSNFQLYKPCSQLKPEDFGHARIKPGEKEHPERRPHYDKYIERSFQPFDTADHQSVDSLSEDDIVKELREGRSVALTGPPTDGTTRTMFELTRRMNGFSLIRPRADRQPSPETLALARRQPVLLLVDNINEFAKCPVNLTNLRDALRENGSMCAVMATCRDGSEMSAVTGESAHSIKGFYDNLSHKLALVPLDNSAKLKLLKDMNPSDESPNLVDYPTVGWICMDNAFKEMRSRYFALSNDNKNDEIACLWTMQLLLNGGVLPLGHARILCVANNVFKRSIASIRDVLNRLKQLAFLHESSDPAEPENAYLRWITSKVVVPYRDGDRNPDTDVDDLKAALVSGHYAEGSISLGVMYYVTKRLPDAIDTSETLDSEFAGAPEPALREQVAKALVNKGVVLGQLVPPELEEEIATYDEVVARFGDAPEPALRKWVAVALVNKGITLGELDPPQRDRQITTYDEVVKRFGGDTEPAIREVVAKALVNKGVVLGQLNPPQRDRQIATYDDLVRRFGGDTEPAIREWVARALFDKGVTLGQLDPPQRDRQIDTYDDLVRRFGDAPEPALREQVVMALINKCVVLGELDPPQRDRQIDTYDDLVRRFGDAPEPAIREQVAKALFNKGVTLGELDPPQRDRQIATYDDLVRRFGGDTEPAIREVVAGALINKGFTLGELDPPQREEEIATYDEVVGRFGDAPEPTLREQVAKALVNKGVVLGQLDPPQRDRQIATYDDLVRRFGGDTEPALREVVAKALLSKGLVFALQNKLEDALRTLNEVIERLNKGTETTFNNLLGDALRLKRLGLLHLGREDEARQVEDEMRRRGISFE